MSLKRLLHRLTAPVSELDVERLREFCANCPGVVPISEARAREEVSVVGEISSLRIVPRAGSPSLEATIGDTSGTIVAMWTGRRSIAGVAPGKRLVVSGRATVQGGNGRLMLMNPRYELL